MSSTRAPEIDRWTIDVCRFCRRQAKWPFCEHRDKPTPDGKPWCVPVVVKPALPGEYKRTIETPTADAG